MFLHTVLRASPSFEADGCAETAVWNMGGNLAAMSFCLVCGVLAEDFKKSIVTRHMEI